MSPSPRVPSSERREAILAASVELFSRHGQHGVTTRMIADAAGISEALLYRHFRGKDELFDELQRFCLRDTQNAAARLAEVEPSTETLVKAVFFTVHQIAGKEACAGGGGSVKRLILSSLVGDGTFARGFLETNFRPFVARFLACLDAAYKAGDLVDRPRHAAVRVWAMHNLACMAANLLLPDPPVVDYGVKGDTLIEELTLFSLRGLGVSPAAIERHFDARALFAFTKSLLGPPAAAPVKKAKKGDRS